MMRSVLVFVLIAALAASAGAYDLLYSNDTAAVAEANSFGARVSFIYFTADQWYNADGDAENGVVYNSFYFERDATYDARWFVADFYYTPLERLELGVTPVFMMEKVDMPENGGAVMDYDGTGLGDTWAWVKYNFSPDPMLSARAGVKIPTGNEVVLDGEYELALGSGQMDIDAAIMFAAPVGAGQLDGSVGYRYRMETASDDEDVFYWKPGGETHFFVGFTHFLGDAMNIRLGADGYFGADDEEEAIPGSGTLEVRPESASGIISINPGFDYMTDGGWSFGFDVHYPLMGANNNAPWGIELSVGFGK